MTRIIMNGSSGRMGKVIAGLVADMQDVEIVAGVDVFDDGTAAFPVFKSLAECDVEADVVIDFSSAKAVDAMLDAAVGKNLPVVLCTTGLSTEQLDHVREAAAKIAVLKSANMSLGINTIIKMLKTATDVFSNKGYDIEIIEEHHHNKLDAPSGTALALADAINEAADGKYEYVYDRSQRREKRPENEIGISAIRAGSIPGLHDVIFAGPDEVIEIKHTAYSRSIFGNGAISAAIFLAGKKAGMYDMSDVIAAM